jgi:hypothetical protein
MKVAWLVCWNSSTPTWTVQKFSDVVVGEEKLSTWLEKACWYAGVGSICPLWIMLQFSFILNSSIYQNYDNFDMLCISQLIDVAIDSFNSIVAKDGIVLNLTGLYGLDTLPVYLEKWCMQLWDLAFPTVFKGVSTFKKSNVFIDYRGVTSGRSLSYEVQNHVHPK